MAKRELKAEELHFLGIKVVYKWMVDEGYEVLQVRKEMGINPQILAKKNNDRFLVVVRTATYPHMGILFPDVAGDVKKLSEKHSSKCMFGSVGIANASGETDEEMGKPEKDGEYYINFKGLTAF